LATATATTPLILHAKLRLLHTITKLEDESKSFAKKWYKVKK
jgi:hypothetical protein